MAEAILFDTTKKDSIMRTPFGHLTYCTNIHAGESWEHHFEAIQNSIPVVKQNLSPDEPLGIGLRLGNAASTALTKAENLRTFRNWLQQCQCYVFTLNGFPYGGFHHTVVKDKVHEPDWTTMQRVDYTIRLAQILAALQPGSIDGGISTSPLTYRHWYKSNEEEHVFEKATLNILQVVKALVQIKQTTGKSIHLDIEPEPDGLLESGKEFIRWYNEYLLPIGIPFLQEQFQWGSHDAVRVLKEHVQLCYDICHFAVGYEHHADVLQQLKIQDIRVGKIQISAALKGVLSDKPEERSAVINAFKQFNETTYLHQVVSKSKDGQLKRYKDLPQALQDADDPSAGEWRAHFHVPLFVENYGALQSTQKDIKQVLQLQREQPFTNHLEVETYTWEVLPKQLKLPLSESIIREMQWVLQEIKTYKEVDV
jgi:hypothetical protein